MAGVRSVNAVPLLSVADSAVAIKRVGITVYKLMRHVFRPFLRRRSAGSEGRSRRSQITPKQGFEAPACLCQYAALRAAPSRTESFWPCQQQRGASDLFVPASLEVCAHHFSLNVPVSFRHSFAMVPTGPPRRFATTTSHGYQSISVSCHCP